MFWFWFIAIPRRVLTRVLAFFVWGNLRCGDGSFVAFALVGRCDMTGARCTGVGGRYTRGSGLGGVGLRLWCVYIQLASQVERFIVFVGVPVLCDRSHKASWADK